MPKQVLLIMCDTQRQDMISAYDPDFCTTPHIDSLTLSGTKFTEGYTCQPVCGPARSAIFTGLYPHTNGMVSNCMQLGANVKTAGEWITPHGIRCGYIGKWHLDGGDYFGYGKCPAGYLPEYWYDMRNFLDELSPEERQASRKPMKKRLSGDVEEKDTYAGRCTERALRFLDEFQTEDFFLTVSFDEPHDPSICPQSYLKQLKRERFALKESPNIKASLKYKPEHQRIWAKKYRGVSLRALSLGMRGFFACNRFVDDQVGRILKRVRALGLDPMIIYTADHGEMMLSHGLLGKGAVMYQEVTRVPFIIAGGGFVRNTSGTPVSHIDLLPTILEFFQIPIPKMLQGESLFSVQDGYKKRDVFMEFTRYEVDHDGFMGFQPIRCIADGKYKLVINLMCEDELYDLKKDPYEMENLIWNEESVEVRDAMHERLIEWMNRTRDVFRGYYWHARPWRKGIKPSFDHTGYTRQAVEEDFVQLDYATGLPMQQSSRKK